LLSGGSGVCDLLVGRVCRGGSSAVRDGRGLREGGLVPSRRVAIADAVQARRQLLHTVRSARAIAELCVGDTVMFTSRIRPRYLEHELGEVTEVDDRTVAVRLRRPMGRFGERELRCPPLALRKLDRGAPIVHS
jgi:hypothetical protein